MGREAGTIVANPANDASAPPGGRGPTFAGLMLTYLYIAIGGALGSMARYAVSGAVARGVDEIFPWGTLTANVTGCFIIGLVAMLTGPGGRLPVASDLRSFVMVGFCGGYTTFSSFSLQTLTLARDGDLARASANVVVSVIVCLVGVYLGVAAGNVLNHVQGA